MKDADGELAEILAKVNLAKQREPNHRLKALLAELESLIHRIRNELAVEIAEQFRKKESDA